MKIFVQAKPNSRQEEVKQIDDTHFVVSVTEPPRGGKANGAIVRAIADYFKISQSRVMLISGAASKNKVFEID